MIKRQCSLLFVISVFSCQSSEVVIRDYQASDKDAVMAMAFQDSELLFGDLAAAQQGALPRELFDAENRRVMEELLANTSSIKTVLLRQATVAGFVEFSKDQEKSVEFYKRAMAKHGRLPDEEAILKAMPHLKKLMRSVKRLLK